MRPPRIAILLLFLVASLFLVGRAVSSLRRPKTTGVVTGVVTTVTSSSSNANSHFGTFFSFSAPFSLFPPNAVISLTDDNSTFFPARPAAFGPPFPSRGLSGQLWIGSGFADDNLQEGEGEGELGCSDVAGWEDGRALKATEQAIAADKAAAAASKGKNAKRDDANRKVAAEKRPQGRVPPDEDGTDDYLHQGLSQTKKTSHDSTSPSGTNHADIQVIQETAEITGRVVLLSRGGCGFLEKVKWAQRRGAVALIVGDNQKGGPLIQMFARGNVDNVTIPSVFTSRTTAHLLSSLMQPGSFVEAMLDESGNAVQKVQPAERTKKGKKARLEATATLPATVATANSRADARPLLTKDDLVLRETTAPTERARSSWFGRLFNWGGSSKTVSDRSRPPSSGRLDWVIVDEWSDEKDKQLKKSLDKATKKNGQGGMTSDVHNGHHDNFQIGVEDWRDPDLVGSSERNSRGSSGKDAGAASDKEKQGERQDVSVKPTSKKPASASLKDAHGPKGGSITPGSGEYSPEPVKDSRKTAGSRKSDNRADPAGLISKMFGDDDGADFGASDAWPRPNKEPSTPASTGSKDKSSGDQHEGLWVTITPTGSASPFFDTLLVLVVSPLITLTVVYALLILRAKIRRRRWRAPKSVVDQLPVRTYHAVAPSPSQSPRLPSPTNASATTPLLQGPSRSRPRPRPRSRTTTGVPGQTELLGVETAMSGSSRSSPSGEGEHEKVATSGNMSSEWKKYMGRQVECVVCLEEYVDGVSRVMSLPCGHEFHAECITPWLTTRRRTCPICKGDVVRSLARGPPSSPRYEPYHDDSDDDIEATASGANGPAERGADTAHGILAAAPAPRRGRRHPVQDGWYNLIANGLGAGPSFRPRRSASEEEDDRARSRMRF